VLPKPAGRSLEDMIPTPDVAVQPLRVAGQAPAR
jgi:hypothetical protein